MTRGTVAVAFTLSGAAVAAAALAVVAVIRQRSKNESLRTRPRAASGECAEIVVRSTEELEQVAGDAERSNAVSAVDLRQTLSAVPVQHLANLSNLARLDVGGCGLTQLPSDISVLRKLEVLLAPRNKLTEVPPELGRLARTLVQLDLGSNQLKSVPPELCQLTGLRSLNLMDNQLERLPQDIGRLRKLRLLGLKSNKLTELPASISQLTDLVELFITDNRLTDLPPGMSRCTSLVKLQASFNAFTDLPSCLLRLPRLELLRVAVCAIQALPARLLEEGAMPCLAWFSVAGNPACPVPPAPAPGLPVVQEDDLELGQKLGDGASGVVYRAVWQGQLVAVKFFRSDVSPDGRTEDEVALAIALQHPHLTQVLAKVAHPPGLVLRLAEGGPLAHKPTSKHLLRCKWGDVRFSPRRALLLAAAVADALSYCHAAGICHGDVYAHNVLMDEDENVTLCDFGASFSYDPKEQPYWQAVEVRAYGLMLLDVAQRCGDAAPSSVALASAGEAAERIVAALREVAHRCTELRPSLRPSFATLDKELHDLQAELAGKA